MPLSSTDLTWEPPSAPLRRSRLFLGGAVDGTGASTQQYLLGTTSLAGIVREAVLTDASSVQSINVAGLTREVMVTDSPSVRIGSVVRESLLSGGVVVQISGLVREVLRTNEATTGGRPYLQINV